jgi:hypothetical protein
MQAHGVRRIKVSGVSVQRRRWPLASSQIEKETLIQSIRRRRIRLWKIQALAGGD